MYYKFYKPLQKQNQPQFFTSHGRNKKEETKMETVQNFILKDDEKKLKEWISEQPQEDLLLANENSVVISAVHFSSKRCLRVLAEAGFDLDYTNGWTPSALSLAMEFGDEESGRILLNHGAKLDSVDSWSRTNIISHDNIECLTASNWIQYIKYGLLSIAAIIVLGIIVKIIMIFKFTLGRFFAGIIPRSTKRRKEEREQSTPMLPILSSAPVIERSADHDHSDTLFLPGKGLFWKDMCPIQPV